MVKAYLGYVSRELQPSPDGRERFFQFVSTGDVVLVDGQEYVRLFGGVMEPRTDKWRATMGEALADCAASIEKRVADILVQHESLVRQSRVLPLPRREEG